jgi:hypothetical protein
MEDSSVIECVEQTPGNILAFTSWNAFRSNNRVDVVSSQKLNRFISIKNSKIFHSLKTSFELLRLASSMDVFIVNLNVTLFLLFVDKPLIYKTNSTIFF